jgi:putative membrane protein
MAHSRTLTVVVAGLAAAFGTSALAQDADDSKFLQDAIQTDIAEVKLAELALQRSNDDGVRDFAHRLQTDHSSSMQQAAALAKDLGTRIPSAPSDAATQKYTSLATLSGPAFDAEFVNHMVAGHREAIGAFEERAHANTNAAIAALATKSLPTLKEHLAMAETLLGVGASSSARPHGAAHAGHDAPAADHDARRDPQLRVPPPEASPPRL